ELREREPPQFLREAGAPVDDGIAVGGFGVEIVDEDAIAPARLDRGMESVTRVTPHQLAVDGRPRNARNLVAGGDDRGSTHWLSDAGFERLRVLRIDIG